MDIDLENLVVLEAAKRGARAVLSGFLSADPDERTATLESLRPRDEDYAAVFSPEVIDPVRQNTERLWRRSKPPSPGSRTELKLACTMAENVAKTDEFPGGYRRLAGHVVPGRVWILFKFTEPGSRSGLAFDGLVQVEADRFAWFPKPWRAVPEQ